MLEQPRTRLGALARTAFVALMAALVVVSTSGDADARKHRGGGRTHYRPRPPALPPGATDPMKDAALIVDGETGRVLYSRNAYTERHPASLTKMMTLYLLFEALKRGDVTMQTMIPISEHAASQRPTNLHLYAGDMIPVDTAIKALVVRSANDVAVAIGEALGGTEGHFAEMMTEKARQLGMRNTFYRNASGLPNPLQITTASDLVVLARHLAYDFPQYFPYFSTPGFSFRNTAYVTHNNLIGRYEGADGIKTGYTSASGFNLVTSVVRNGMHIIGVVMGGRTAHRRDVEMVTLLDTAFMQIARNPSLVARNGVPWRNVALNAPQAFASFDVAPVAGDDEESAESAALDEEAASDPVNEIAAPPPPRPTIVAAAPQPAVPPKPVYAAPPPPAPSYTPAPLPPRVASLPPQQPPLRTATAEPPRVLTNIPRPTPKPSAPAPAPLQVAAADMPRITPKPTQVAALAPAPAKPTNKPLQRRQEIGEGDIEAGAAVAALGAKAWTIQIGAFADMTQARGQLASYAEKSMDILGQAARIIIPFTGVDGHTLYRARFGPFVEREAREVCSRLTERGQTCFTVLAASR